MSNKQKQTKKQIAPRPARPLRVLDQEALRRASGGLSLNYTKITY